MLNSRSRSNVKEIAGVCRMPPRLDPAPGGGTSNPQTFTITNPVPTTTGLTPTSAVAGGPGFTLTVTGTNLVRSSVVRWNGADRATTYTSATQLTAVRRTGHTARVMAVRERREDAACM